MTPLALVLVIFGLLIAISRAPFIIAPGATRAFYLKWFETDARMRGLGLLVIALGAALIWAGGTDETTIAKICFGLGLFMVTLGAVFFILLPGLARTLSNRVWNSFSEPVLRLIGLAAVIFGLAVAWYGWTL